MASAVAKHEASHVVVARHVAIPDQHEIVRVTIAVDGSHTRTRYRLPTTRSEKIAVFGREAVIAAAALSIDDEAACATDRTNLTKHCEAIIRVVAQLHDDVPLNHALAEVVSILAEGCAARAARIVTAESAAIERLAEILDERGELNGDEIAEILTG